MTNFSSLQPADTVGKTNFLLLTLKYDTIQRLYNMFG